MKLTHATRAVIAATLSLAPCVRAFAPGSRSDISSRLGINNVVVKSFTSTSLSMIFDKLFTERGSKPRIDYSTLPYPCLDLATMAKEGVAPEQLTHNGKTYNVATFAGGCFWSVELAFQRVPGVGFTCVGYSQGKEQMPTYDEVCFGATGHTEAVCVLYDAKECTYETLLDVFLSKVNPTTVNGQGNDYGPQYRTGVYWHSKEQEALARARLVSEQQKYAPRKIASEFLPAQPFWPAEKYHQQYLEKGGRFGMAQSAAKNCADPIRCYG